MCDITLLIIEIGTSELAGGKKFEMGGLGYKRGMVMMGNLTHSKNLKWKKRPKLVGIKKLWMVRELFEKYLIRPPK